MRDFDERLMELTLFGVSQATPGHLQKLGPVQPAGVGEMDWASLVMTAPSSEAAWWMTVAKIVVKKRQTMQDGRNLCLPLGILVAVCFLRWR